MTAKVKIEGFRELEQALAEEMPKATAKNTLRRAGVIAMKTIEDAAKFNAPVAVDEGGFLRDSIKTKPDRTGKRQAGSFRFDASTGVSISTGPTGRQEGGNAAYQEFGTVKMGAKPYMRPAADAGGEKVVEDIKQVLTEQIEKAKTRIAKKAARAK